MRVSADIDARPGLGSRQSEWDAVTYDRVADPMSRWGAAVLERLPLAGHERVLDAPRQRRLRRSSGPPEDSGSRQPGR